MALAVFIKRHVFAGARGVPVNSTFALSAFAGGCGVAKLEVGFVELAGLRVGAGTRRCGGGLPLYSLKNAREHVAQVAVLFLGHMYPFPGMGVLRKIVPNKRAGRKHHLFGTFWAWFAAIVVCERGALRAGVVRGQCCVGLGRVPWCGVWLVHVQCRCALKKRCIAEAMQRYGLIWDG